jgi:parallel beta-helix repeat protein
MTRQTKATLAGYFNAGDVPTEAQFANLIDTIPSQVNGLTVAASDASAEARASADYVCDGTNDEVQIQAAIDALGSTGGKVILSAGNFLINSVTYYNSGHGNQHWYSIIILASHGPISLEGIRGATKIKLADTQHDTTYMLNITGTNNTTFRTNPTYVSGIWFDCNGTNQPTPFPGEYSPAININYTNGVFIDHCRFSNPKIYSIEFELIGDRSVVSNCYFEGGGGVCCNQYFLTVTGNIFDLMASPPSAVSCGVGISPDSDEAYPGGGYYYQYGAIVSNNIFKGGNTQIDMVSTYGCTIANNVFSNKTSGYALRIIPINFTEGGKYNVVTGNTFFNVTAGIWLYQGANNNLITGNIFMPGQDRAMDYGIVEQSAETLSNFITGNIFKSNGECVRRLTGAGTGTIIRNNLGFVTENHGAAATVADGGTIDHGLVAAPTWVNLTPSVANEMVSATTLDATHITVAIKKHDGSAGTTQTIYWEAEV